MTYRKLLILLRKQNICQVGRMRQDNDPGDVTFLGVCGEVAMPNPPKSGLYPIYRDRGDDTIIRKEVVDAICRTFSINPIPSVVR